MNFFQNLTALQVKGGWNISVNQHAENKLVVSVLFGSEQCGDEARKLIPPIILRGTAEELDEGFFKAIAKPIQSTADLFSNMEAYLVAQEQAKKLSAMEKDKQAKADKDKADKQKKYESAMKKVDELEGEGKYKEAWMKVPEPTEYPDHADAIRKRKSALSERFAPDLFATAQPTEPSPNPELATPETDEESTEEMDSEVNY